MKTHRSIRLSTLLTGALCGLLGCLSGCAEVGVQALPPNPNVLAHRQIDATYTAAVAGKHAEEFCAEGLERTDARFCVQGFHAALGQGLNDLLSRYVRPGPRPILLRGELRVVDFSIGLAPGGHAGQLLLRYQFALRGLDGRPLLELAETVIGPEYYSYGLNPDHVVRALFNSTLERIGAAVDRMELSPEVLAKEQALADERRTQQERQALADERRTQQERQAAEQRRANAARVEQEKALWEARRHITAEQRRAEAAQAEQELQQRLAAQGAAGCGQYIQKNKVSTFFVHVFGTGGTCWKSTADDADRCLQRCRELSGDHLVSR